MTFFALHGFLGTAMDWKQVLPPQTQLKQICCSLYDTRFAAPEKGLVCWGDSFNAFAQEIAPPPRYLIGYSLGGRLGLHALLQSPHIWHAAIFVSTHPGLPQEERPARAKQDSEWAKAFETTPFPELLTSWNQQPLFGGTPFPSPRSFQEQDRLLLVSSLRHWSLSQQNHLQEDLAGLSLPILWIVGSQDARCLQASSQLSFRHPLSNITVINNVGHRAPWENKDVFSKIILRFIQTSKKMI